jgi:hypothetical protein
VRPAVAGLAALAFGAALPAEWVLQGPQLCIFKLISGLPCPGCGLTRAVVFALDGDLSSSFYFHPFGVPFIVALLLLAGIDLVGWWYARRHGHLRLSPSWLLERLARTPAPWIVIGALLALWAVRLPMYVLGSWVF